MVWQFQMVRFCNGEEQASRGEPSTHGHTGLYRHTKHWAFLLAAFRVAYRWSNSMVSSVSGCWRQKPDILYTGKCQEWLPNVRLLRMLLIWLGVEELAFKMMQRLSSAEYKTTKPPWHIEGPYHELQISWCHFLLLVIFSLTP
jgi:hypothetical protein